MNFIKDWFYKLLGKKVGEEVGVSRTKLAAVIAVVVVGVQQISAAWGHPITIPEDVFKVLAAAGLWSLRSAISDK